MDILSGIKNIIFDFGGVVINIDYYKTRNAFIKLGAGNFDEIYSQFQQNPIFDLFETGKIDEDEFFSQIKALLPDNIRKEQLIEAWNAMLQDFPEENLQFLRLIKDQYRTFLLSNTNETHLRYYFKKIDGWYGLENMDSLFEKTYYSCRVGLRKPNTDIFQFVLKDSGLEPEETLFIDDSPQHIEGAKKCGIRAYHLKSTETIIEIMGS